MGPNFDQLSELTDRTLLSKEKKLSIYGPPTRKWVCFAGRAVEPSARTADVARTEMYPPPGASPRIFERGTNRQVANLPLNTKKHRIWATSFSNLGGRPLLNFSLEGMRPLRPPSPLSTPMHSAEKKCKTYGSQRHLSGGQRGTAPGSTGPHLDGVCELYRNDPRRDVSMALIILRCRQRAARGAQFRETWRLKQRHRRNRRARAISGRCSGRLALCQWVKFRSAQAVADICLT